MKDLVTLCENILNNEIVQCLWQCIRRASLADNTIMFLCAMGCYRTFQEGPPALWLVGLFFATDFFVVLLGIVLCWKSAICLLCWCSLVVHTFFYVIGDALEFVIELVVLLSLYINFVQRVPLLNSRDVASMLYWVWGPLSSLHLLFMQHRVTWLCKKHWFDSHVRNASPIKIHSTPSTLLNKNQKVVQS